MQRTVLNVTVIVETDGSYEEHKNSVAWAANQIKESPRFVRGGFVAVQVTDARSGKVIGFSGHGTSPSTETTELVEELFDAAPGKDQK